MACQAYLARQEYWSGLPCPPPGDLPDTRIEPASLTSPALAAGSLPLGLPGKPQYLVSVQFSPLSRVRLCDPMNRSTPGLPVHHNSQSSLKLMSIKSVMSSSHHILCRPLRLLSPVPPSIRVFSSESTLRMWWPKYWSFRFSISPSKEIPGMIFRMDWLDLLAVQGTLKSLLQHQSSKASILWRSAFFTVQLSHPYMTTGKTIALIRWNLLKVMSLLLNMLSRLVIIFIERVKVF